MAHLVRCFEIAKKSWDDGGKDIPEETKPVEDLPSDEDMGGITAFDLSAEASDIIAGGI